MLGEIGINTKNRVKVWLNHNYAINQPEPAPHSYAQLSPHDQEREMVMGVFDLIDAKTDHDALWIDFIKLKEKRNPYTFDEALNLLDYFSGANHINISDSVSNLFNKRYYHPQEEQRDEQQRVAQYYDEKIARANQQSAQTVSNQTTIVRRPFEEIEYKGMRVNAVPVMTISQSMQQPHPFSIHAPLTQSHNLVQATTNTRPTIRFNIKTATENVPLSVFTPVPQQ